MLDEEEKEERPWWSKKERCAEVPRKEVEDDLIEDEDNEELDGILRW